MKVPSTRPEPRTNLSRWGFDPPADGETVGDEEGGYNLVRSLGDQDRLRVEYEPVRANIRRARRAATEFAERIGADATSVALAVSEAVTNVVLHAYRGAEPRTFRLEAELDDDRLLVAVIDRGIGMTPNPGSPGAGLGLSLIGHLADSVEIDSSEEGMSIRMIFAVVGREVVHPLRVKAAPG